MPNFLDLEGARFSTETKSLSFLENKAYFFLVLMFIFYVSEMGPKWFIQMLDYMTLSILPHHWISIILLSLLYVCYSLCLKDKHV